jgi:hypothetical protein
MDSLDEEDILIPEMFWINKDIIEKDFEFFQKYNHI